MTTNSMSSNLIHWPGIEISKITTNWSDGGQTTESKSDISEECQSKLDSISKNIFGYYWSETVDLTKQQQNINDAITQLKKNKVDGKIKIFSLAIMSEFISNVCKEFVSVAIELWKPPQLMPLLRICENVFDWLLREDSNMVLFICNKDEPLLHTVLYAYSCYYDSMPSRDIRQSMAIKSFLSCHSKMLEKVPVSYRRYAGYMNLYSCMNQLQSYRSSVSLHCLILYNFPAMESNKSKSSQLFFKIYTNEPLKCSHTTKLYCLPSNVSRLVILFDQYPILLRNDCMIICYHSNVAGNKRTKILRVNFHICQATSDMITFYCQDFEDLYPGTPYKIKLDLYFQATAVFRQAEANFTCNTGHHRSSQLERFDSYNALSVEQTGQSHQSFSRWSDKTDRASTKSELNQRLEGNIRVTEMNQEYTDAAATDSYQTPKLEPVLTGFTNVAVQSQQISHMNQINDILVTSTNVVDDKNEVITQTKSNDSKESQMMSELVEAQRELSCLRQINSHGDCVDNVLANKHNRSKINSNDNPRILVTSSHEHESVTSNSKCHLTTSYMNRDPGDRFTMDGSVMTTSSSNVYMPHITWERTPNENSMTTKPADRLNQSNDITSNDLTEEIESFDLQPIGKGIHDLTRRQIQSNIHTANSAVKLNREKHITSSVIGHLDNQSATKGKQNAFSSKSYFHQSNNESVSTLSAFLLNDNQRNLTVESVEKTIRWWYQPKYTRDDTIAVLKQCAEGSFLIRDSTTFSGAYGLAVKVACIPTHVIPKSDDLEAEKVRHYLIDSVGAHGVCIKGYPEEPIFPSLSHLVLFYSQIASVLSCLLVLPSKALSELSIFIPKTSSSFRISSPKSKEYSVCFVGEFDVEYITAPSIINKAIERLFVNPDPRKFAECQLKIIYGDGIELTDVTRKIFIRRIYSFRNITACALDPRNRKIELDICKSSSMKKSRLFGIIIKSYGMEGNKCLLMAEQNSNETADIVVKAVSENLHSSTFIT